MSKNYEKLAESLEYENNVLKSKFKEIEQDLDMVKIAFNHKSALLESCEKALEERDNKLRVYARQFGTVI